MQAVKVFNNNAVSVVMPDGREAILVGNGLGFGRRPGDVIDKSRVSKVKYCSKRAKKCNCYQNNVAFLHYSTEFSELQCLSEKLLNYSEPISIPLRFISIWLLAK